jgi:hypothetical protein
MSAAEGDILLLAFLGSMALLLLYFLAILVKSVSWRDWRDSARLHSREFYRRFRFRFRRFRHCRECDRILVLGFGWHHVMTMRADDIPSPQLFGDWQGTLKLWKGWYCPRCWPKHREEIQRAEKEGREEIQRRREAALKKRKERENYLRGLTAYGRLTSMYVEDDQPLDILPLAAPALVRELLPLLPIATPEECLHVLNQAWNEASGEERVFFPKNGRDYSSKEILDFTVRWVVYLNGHGAAPVHVYLVPQSVDPWDRSGDPKKLSLSSSQKINHYGRSESLDRGTISVLRVGSDTYKACYKSYSFVVDLSKETLRD